MKNEENNEELLEESEYSKKTEFSKAVLSSSQVERCLISRSKDMRPGYTTFILDNLGQAHPKIVSDTRKEFISSVEALKNLLAPEIKMNKDSLEKNYKEKKQKVFDKYAYKERVAKVYDSKKEKNVWVFSGIKYLPQKGEIILIDSRQYPQSSKVETSQGGWDNLVNAYWDEMVDVADELFQELNNLIHQLEYFKGGTSF